MTNKLFCKNYKTGEDIKDFAPLYQDNQLSFLIVKSENDYYKRISLGALFDEQGCDNQDAFDMSVLDTQLDPIMQKVVEKTGCMVFGDYVVYEPDMVKLVETRKLKPRENCWYDYWKGFKIYSPYYDVCTVYCEDITVELAKHYAGEDNGLKEFLK